MGEYTPTTNRVRVCYKLSRTNSQDVLGEEFDRWLATHDREVRRVAWAEGFADGFNSDDYKMTNPYREGVTDE
jgi:hypothetical protein